MKLNNHRKWRIIRNYIIGWILALIFLSIIRGIGTIERGSVQFEFWQTLIVSFIFGIFFGSISGLAQIVTEEKMYKRMPLKKVLLIRFVYSVLFIATLVLVSYGMVVNVFNSNVGLLEFAIEPGSFPIYFYILSVDIFMVVLRQVNLLLGEKNLGKFLTGKFYTPREEQRIFMFLDLQSSTTHAEKLGHIKYSMLLQDCFNDLGVVAENEAEIYQYVGDEVILTWELENGLKNQNCIKAYYAFSRQLDDKKDYYLNSYGCEPFFKAGLHGGIVTVTEIGKYKKEIAYHGDTINTAARIQAKCNEFQQGLLISEYLKNNIDTKGYTLTALGAIPLKGKKEEVGIYAVNLVKPS